MTDEEKVIKKARQRQAKINKRTGSKFEADIRTALKEEG
jgi:hypothetical protein